MYYFHFLLSVLLFTSRCLEVSSDVDAASCMTQSLDRMDIEADAQFKIGVLINAHEAGDGLYGCGEASDSGVQAFEALRMAVAMVNRRPMNTDRLSMQKAMSGIKIGLKVLDSCGHPRKTVEHLTELFPVLKMVGTSSKSCLDNIDNQTSEVLGVIDLTEVLSDDKLKSALRQSSIPLLPAPLDFTYSLNPDHVSRVILEVTYSMEWNRFAVIHAVDPYSRSVAKSFSEVAKKGHICIAMEKELSTSTLAETRAMIKEVSSSLGDGGAVIVVAHGESLAHLLRAMKEETEATKQQQWLFSSVPDSSTLAMLGKLLNGTRMFSITPFPGIREEFETRWGQIGATQYASPKFLWHAELAAKKLSKCYNNEDKTACLVNGSIVPDNPVHALQRTSIWLTMVDALEEYITSIRNAWFDACGGGSRPLSSGPCPELLATSRKVFLDKYFKPSRFQNRETETGFETKLALTQYLYDDKKGIHFNQIAVYEESGSDIKDTNFQYMPSKCINENCAMCAKLSHTTGRSLENLEAMDKQSLTTIAVPGDLLIPLLLPIHQQGESPLECSEELNENAIQDLESALWIIDKINQDSSFLRGIQLGIQVIDTCSSSSQVAHRLSDLLAENLPFASAPAFVSSLDPISSSVAAALLSPLNITYISAKEVTYGLNGYSRENNPYILQVPVNPKTRANAIVQVLKKMNWDFVSLVYSPGIKFKSEVEAVKRSLKEAAICVAFEEPYSGSNIKETNKILSGLIDARDRGGKAIILITDEVTTRQLFSVTEDYILSGKIEAGDFIWLASGDWTKNPGVVLGLESVAQGSLLFSPTQINVEDFVTHYRWLKPENNNRNPFFSNFWRQSLRCGDKGCDDKVAVQYKPSHSVGQTMQAILSVAAGLARARNELCSTDTLGLCPRFLMEPQIRQVFNHYIRYTRAIHPDSKGGMFGFTDDGYGDSETEIFNFRKLAGGSFMYQKIGSYRQQLSNLLPVVTYDKYGKEQNLEKRTSSCLLYCAHCSKKADDFLIVSSPNDLYLAAVFDIREPDLENPLRCKKTISVKGIRRLQAFLWALDQANGNILGNSLKLGAIIMDSCSSRAKLAKDVSNFLTNSLSNDADGELPSSVVDGTLSILTTAETRSSIEPLIALTGPLKIPTISLSPVDLDLTKTSTLSLSYSMPDDLLCDCFLAILKSFKWDYVSVVTSHEGSRGSIIFQKLQKVLDSNSIQVAIHEEMIKNPKIQTEVSESILYGLVKKQVIGAKVVLLLTTTAETMSILSSAQELQKRGKFQPSDFLYIGLDNVEAFQKYPDQTLGGLVVRSKIHQEGPFVQYFSKLTSLMTNETKNSWFKQFVEQQKELGKFSSIPEVGRQGDSVVSNTIQSVLSVASAVLMLYKTECNEKSEGCLKPNTNDKRSLLRERIYNKTKDAVLLRSDGIEVSFGDKQYVDTTMEILNFRQLGSHSLAFVTVGSYTEQKGLMLNTTNTRGYTSRGIDFPLSTVQSKCQSNKGCAKKPKVSLPNTMYINRNAKVLLGALMPVHKEGSNLFTCGPLNSAEMFENVVALAYAIENVNKNKSLLKDVNIGAIIFDYCNQEQRAEQKLYSYFADKTDEGQKDAPNIISMMTFEDSVAEKVSSILEVNEIPVILNPGPSRKKRSVPKDSESIRTMSSFNGQIDAILALLKHYDWRYVNVIEVSGDSEMNMASYFYKRARERRVCVAARIKLDAGLSMQDIGTSMREGLTDPQPRVVVLLSEDSFSTRLVLKAAKDASLLSRFVWVGTEGWAVDDEVASLLDGSNVDAFTVTMESPVLSGIENYFTNLTLVKHDPIPDAWFEEYWQEHFQCRLADARFVQKQYPDVCKGSETLSKGSLIEKRIQPVVDAVYAVANSLDGQVKKLCPSTMSSGCMEILDAKMLMPNIKENLAHAKLNYIFNIYHLGNTSDGVYSYTKVGIWNEGQSDLTLENIEFPGGPPLSLCIGSCTTCVEQMSTSDVLAALKRPLGIYDNFQTVWGITTTALSVLGVALVVICAVYFLMAFPVTVGTTVLGYKILFGLLLLYAVNFAFILSPTESTCGVRRFVMGLAYSVIFSGMLIKVMNTWRLMGSNGNRMMTDATRMSSPAGLLVIAVGLVVVQIILTAAWLVLMPPKTGLYRGMWRCSPPTTFEDELIISLVYVMLLLAVTILFSVLTWKCRENGQESRWILACCVFVAIVWVAWTVLSTHLPVQFRDPTIVIANLLCATLVMLCLYMRKVYVYSKLTRQLKRRDLKSQLKGSVPYQHSLYGTLQNNLSSVAPVLCGSQASLTTKSFYGGGFGHVHLDEAQSEAGGSTSSGSVQVQGTDLYPLEMYDGGSHLSLYGTKTMLGVADGSQYER